MPVTLLTDFGSADHFAASMKGVILAATPRVPVVDISHEIPPQNIRAAAFTLLAVYGTFPAGTVHVVVVDPGVGSERRPVVVAAGGHLFVGPDNGVFSYVLDREAAARVFHLANPAFFRHPVSTTFHGRDVFAPVAAALAAGAAPTEVGTPVTDPVRLAPLQPVRRPGGVLEASIIHIDRFGNCVTSIAAEHLPDGAEGADLDLEVAGRRIRTVRRYYAEPGTATGEPFAILGSAGFLEISVRDGSAARMLGVERGEAVTLYGRADSSCESHS